MSFIFGRNVKKTGFEQKKFIAKKSSKQNFHIKYFQKIPGGGSNPPSPGRYSIPPDPPVVPPSIPDSWIRPGNIPVYYLIEILKCTPVIYYNRHNVFKAVRKLVRHFYLNVRLSSDI